MDRLPALSVGVVNDLSVDRDLDRAVTDLMIHIEDHAEGVESPLNVNVVFYLGGEELEVDWEGPRLGRYSKKENTLLVQVGVPNPPEGDADGFVATQMRAAIGEAEEFAQRRGLSSGSLEALRAVAENA